MDIIQNEVKEQQTDYSMALYVNIHLENKIFLVHVEIQSIISIN